MPTFVLLLGPGKGPHNLSPTEGEEYLAKVPEGTMPESAETTVLNALEAVEAKYGTTAESEGWTTEQMWDKFVEDNPDLGPCCDHPFCPIYTGISAARQRAGLLN